MRPTATLLLNLLTLTMPLVMGGTLGASDQTGTSEGLKMCADISANPQAWIGKDVSITGKYTEVNHKIPKDRMNKSISRDPRSGTVSLRLPTAEELENYIVKRQFVCASSEGAVQDQTLMFMTDKGTLGEGAPRPSLGGLWKVTGKVAAPQQVEAKDRGKKLKRKVPYLVEVKLEPLAAPKP